MGLKYTTTVVLVLLNLLIVCYFLILHNFIDDKVPHSVKLPCYDESVAVRASKLGQTSEAAIMKKRKLERLSSESNSLTERRKMGESLVEDMKRCSLAMGMLEEELNELDSVAKKAQQFLNALRLIFPKNFSQKFRNPCWYPNFTLTSNTERILEDQIHIGAHLDHSQQAKLLETHKDILEEFKTKSHRLFCLPYFFLAGFPKSGTTSLHEALRKHPKIASPVVKEPHWWTRVPLYDLDPDYLKLVAIRYPLYFKSAAREIGASHPGQRITYDGTQSLLWGSTFFSQVKRLDYCVMQAIMSRILPDAKFIILMRNPTMREYSNFFYMCLWDELNKISQGDPPTHFHHVATLAINRILSCLAAGNHSLPWCLSDLNSLQSGCGYIGRRLTIGLYYVHLNKWMQFYPRENFLFLKTEDIRREPQQIMTQITDFLGVDRISDKEARQWLSAEANVQRHYKTQYKMKSETEALLNDFYKPYNKLLANLTGSSHFSWT